MTDNQQAILVFTISMAVLLTFVAGWAVSHWKEILIGLFFMIVFSVLLAALAIWNLVHPA